MARREPYGTGRQIPPRPDARCRLELLLRHGELRRRLRSDASGNPVNRQFRDVDQTEPEIRAEPGFENEVHAFNFFAYLSRSDVTWNPSITAAVKNSLLCPTTEEYMLPIIHGNDRVEWF